METKYGHKINIEGYNDYIERKKNQVFKLLPLREEGVNWQPYLTTVIIELTGFNSLQLSPSDTVKYIEILSKLEGLYKMEDCMLYRKTIFETLTIFETMKKEE